MKNEGLCPVPEAPNLFCAGGANGTPTALSFASTMAGGGDMTRAYCERISSEGTFVEGNEDTSTTHL
jgi:hypothetical protein